MKSLLINSVLPISIVGVLSACSSGSGEQVEEGIHDKQFCECIKVSEELDKFSSELLERTPTEEDAKEMKRLRAQNEKECSKYYMMSGEEMLKRKKMCK